MELYGSYCVLCKYDFIYFLKDKKCINLSPGLATLTLTCIPKCSLYIYTLNIRQKIQSRNLYLQGTDLSDASKLCTARKEK